MENQTSEIIFIVSPSFRGPISPADLLRPSGSSNFDLLRDELRLQEGIIFQLTGESFHFRLYVQKGKVVFERNQD
jgi:hypothetical protein